MRNEFNEQRVNMIYRVLDFVTLYAILCLAQRNYNNVWVIYFQ